MNRMFNELSDLISRQDAIDRIRKQMEHLRPDTDSRDFIGQSAYTVCIEIVERLPSAERKGKWVWVQYDANPELGNFHCSECHFIPACFNWSRKHLNFCPNCGADMRGEKDDT